MTFDEAWNSVHGTAINICKRFSIDGYEWDDLIQEARIAVLEALEKFDESRGAVFNTFYYYKLTSRLNVILKATKAQKNYYNVRRYAIDDNTELLNFAPSDILNPEQQLIKEYTTKTVFNNFNLLHDELKNIVIMKMNGMSFMDIAKELGVAHTVVYRKIRLLAELFKKEPTYDEIMEFNKEYESTIKRRYKK